MSGRKFWLIFVLILGAAALLVGGKLYFAGRAVKTPGGVACTAEAKLCPDGSYVGRAGPDCAFSACPATPISTPLDTSGWKTYTNANFGFSFKYPVAWELSDSAIHADPPSIMLGDPLAGVQTYTLRVSIETNKSAISAASYVARMLKSDKAQDASNSAQGPAPQTTPKFDTQYPIQAPNYNAWELYNVFEFDHNAEQIYIENGNEIIVFDFPVATANPNLYSPAENNQIVHAMLGTLAITKAAGAFCGGIAAFPCPVGYSCDLDGTYPDAGGHCVAASATDQ